MTRPPRSDLFERILGATGFEPRVAVYLLPYPASVGSTEASDGRLARVGRARKGSRNRCLTVGWGPILIAAAIRDTRPAQGKGKSGLPRLFLQNIAFIDLHSIGNLTAHRFVPSGVKEAHDLFR